MIFADALNGATSRNFVRDFASLNKGQCYSDSMPVPKKYLTILQHVISFTFAAVYATHQ